MWANGHDADFSEADLHGANLVKATLQRATMQGTNLRYADCCGADLREVDFEGAVLRGADMRNADVSGANFVGADMYGTRLRGAMLFGRRQRIEPLQITGLRYFVMTDGITMQIGCETHPWQAWLAFDRVRVSEMDEHAWDWWNRHKLLLAALIEQHQTLEKALPLSENASREVANQVG